MRDLSVIMPVKDSLETAERAIRAIVAGGYTLTLYDDFSTPENTEVLDRIADNLHFKVIHLKDITSHPSPNYLLVLQTAQQEALLNHTDLLIVESDVIIRPDTIGHLRQAGQTKGVGMVAAVTVNEQGEINYPYEYAKEWALKAETKVRTGKHLSFCCTLLTNELLNACSFKELNPEKDWFDVTISHRSAESGFQNLLLLDTPVLHLPHSSRPWKKLKYTHPLQYYWHKLIHGKDRI